MLDKTHPHKCMSCGELWECLNPGDCLVGAEAMPSIMLKGPKGPQVFDHVCQRRSAPQAAPLGYVLVELDRINHLTTRLKDLALAGSADAKSLAADAALLLEARRG